MSLIVKRLVATLARAMLLAAMAACLEPGAFLFVLLPTWAALFFVWQYLSRRQDAKISNLSRPTPRSRPSTAWGRIIVTGLLAFGVALLPIADFAAMAGLLTWIVLYHGWPALSRRLPLPESWKIKAQSDRPSTAQAYKSLPSYSTVTDAGVTYTLQYDVFTV